MKPIDLMHPIDPLQKAVLVELVQLLEKLNIDYMLIGALARDILLWHLHGIGAGLATRDADVAILVGSWEEFRSVRAAFIETGKFEEPDPKENTPQRLHFVGSASGYGMPVDLIPFGNIEDDRSKIAWPSDGDFVMNVVGHSEVR